MSASTIRIGISSCLIGEPVRFDGGHKRDGYLNETFARFVEWVPVCPEVEMGLGTPRDTMRLETHAGEIRVINPKSGDDLTRRMETFSRRRVAALASEDLCGYVLKKNSPSCGMERVKVYSGKGAPARNGVGLYAAALMKRYPRLPIEEEGRLTDPRLRDNFIERVFAYRRLRDLFGGRWTLGQLVRFHTVHKLTLMAHSPQSYQSLGRLVARAKDLPHKTLSERYQDGFMVALEVIATPRRHANVLQHMLGYFKKTLDSESRVELAGVIEDYRRELVPLIVPITLFRHHVRRLGVAYLAEQVYLEPHPKELMLRNRV